MKKTEKVAPRVLAKLIDDFEIQKVLDIQVRQVRWLYNNSNKCTMVYDEKLVRLIVSKLEGKITELEKKLK
jgi:hypothetical protein